MNAKKISATMVGGLWVVMVESPPGDPVTMRDIGHFQRALTLKLRVYYMEQRKLALAAVKAAEQAKLATDAKATEVAKLSQAQTLTA